MHQHRTRGSNERQRLASEANADRQGQWDLPVRWQEETDGLLKYSFRFTANVRVDDEDQKVILYPIPHRKEDYVESQLRRLRDNLRSESAKRRRPAKFVLSLSVILGWDIFLHRKAHEPFIYNDLSPYFDTTTVEKAIYEVMPRPLTRGDRKQCSFSSP